MWLRIKSDLLESVCKVVVVCWKIFLDISREKENLPSNGLENVDHVAVKNLKNREFKQSIWAYLNSFFFFFSLPKVCLHYNKGDGPYGSCTFKKICTKLHICQYFLQGQCRFGSSCKRSHDLFNSECYEKLERQGMSSDIIEKLPSIYRNMYDIKNGNQSMYDTEDAKSSLCKGKWYHLLQTSEEESL